MTNPTLLFSSFDNSLALTDLSGLGTWTAVAPTRYAELGSQDGLWAEEPTTNLINNPTAGTDVTGWGAATGTIVRERVTSLPAPLPDGLAGLVTTGFRVTATADDASFGNFQYGNIFTNAVHTYSMYVYVPASYTGSAPRIRALSFTNATGETQLNADLGFRDQWQRLDITFTPDAADLEGGLAVQIAGTIKKDEEFWVAAFQMEQKAYATSYTDGSLGTGYAWSGTAHASTSTRDASSVSVDQDGTARIDPASGSIAFRYKRLIDTGGEETILTCGTVGSGTDYLEIGIDSSDHLYMEWDSNNAGAERVTSTGTIGVDTDYFLYFEWDGTAIGLSIDNGTMDTDTRDAVEGDWGAGDLELVA